MRRYVALVYIGLSKSSMDGYEVCVRLKEDERTRDIPVTII